jgi:hypothetical protein
MNRLANTPQPIESEMAVRLFQRTMANWAADLLRRRPRIAWPEADPQADYQSHDWKALYNGSVLDD